MGDDLPGPAAFRRGERPGWRLRLLARLSIYRDRLAHACRALRGEDCDEKSD